MVKKKEAQEPAGKKQVAAGKKKADTEKAKVDINALVKTASPLDICYVYADGDNIEAVAKLLTGHSRKVFALCEYSGVNLCDVKPGTVLRWPHGC